VLGLGLGAPAGAESQCFGEDPSDQNSAGATRQQRRASRGVLRLGMLLRGMSTGDGLYLISAEFSGSRPDELFESNVIYFRKYVRALNRVGREVALCSFPAQHGNGESSEIRLLNNTSGL
jgi:hypothetical protein